MSNKKIDLVFGIFDDEQLLIQTGKQLVENNIAIYDCYTPCPVHGLDDLMNIKRTRLPYVTFIAGTIGLILAAWFQIWVNVEDWPLNIGGKVFLAIPAFIPVIFELTVLFGALGTVAMFLYRSKMYPSKVPQLIHQRVTDDRFVIAVDKKNLSIDLDKVKKLMTTSGATEVSEWSK